MFSLPKFSKTIAGGLLTGISIVLDPAVNALIPVKYAGAVSVLRAIGVVLTAVGIKHGQQKTEAAARGLPPG